ncbi:MAG: V-type ATPase subunit, partial [Eubacteriales bacterium]|nr:V-type ATPase subunit [Eubacteriales bacterium]
CAARTGLRPLPIALRRHAIGRDGACAREMLLPGGTLDEDARAQVADAPERAAALISGKPYAGALAATLKRTPVDLAEVEKAVDDRLAGLLSGHKNETLTISPLVGYLLEREREAGAVRLIATAKAANVPITTIERRLRAMYGKGGAGGCQMRLRSSAPEMRCWHSRRWGSRSARWPARRRPRRKCSAWPRAARR